jgi:poly-gamma-glutamate system protein
LTGKAAGGPGLRPGRSGIVSPGRLAFLGVTSLVILAGLEGARWTADPLEGRKKEAVVSMQKAMSAVREEKARLGLQPDPDVFGDESGMLGQRYTDLTTTVGLLSAKRTSTRPEFAAALVDMLDEAGARTGDRIAVSFSGSFPALNIAVLSAAKAMGLRLVIISSVGSSMYGANDPLMTWLDMERLLGRTGILPYRSVAASLGGIVDTKGGLDGNGIEEGLAAIRRNGVQVLEEGGVKTQIADVERRMGLFRLALGGRLPAAYVNVGGSQTALGDAPGSASLPTGLSRGAPVSDDPARGVIARMKESGVPVLHLLGIRRLAKRYGIPVESGRPSGGRPAGSLPRKRYQLLVAAAGLVGMTGLLVAISLHRRATPKRGSPLDAGDARRLHSSQ